MIAAHEPALPADSPLGRRARARSRVLVVDDHENLASSLARLLELDGFAVRTAATPDDALGCLREEPVELLVTDLKLRTECGLALAQRCSEERLARAVLFISGDATASVPAHLDGLRSAFLQKPFALADLEDRLRRLL